MFYFKAVAVLTKYLKDTQHNRLLNSNTMTLEELKKIAMCYAHDELKDNCSPIEAVVAGAFMSGIDYIQHNPAWISVEEELPIDYEPVLAVVGGNLTMYTLFQ